MKKQTYIVEVFETNIVKYEVEGESFEGAIQQVGRNNEGSVELKQNFYEVNDDIGMSFEEAKELGLDVEYLRTQFNGDRNAEHIESICSIRLQDDSNEESDQ